MPRARPALWPSFARSILPAALLLAVGGRAAADVGATLSLQSDARERGLSYSAGRPSGQAGLAWDGEAGGYAGASLTEARFTDRRGAWLRVYGGRVVELAPGLDAEAGLLVNRFENVSRYDFVEFYAGLLGQRWSLRLHHARDYFGSGQRSLYGELNLRWPVADGLALVGHVGVLRGLGEARLPFYLEPHGPARIDWRAGASWQVGQGCELQLAWVAVSRGGPYTWAGDVRRQTAVLGLSAAL